MAESPSELLEQLSRNSSPYADPLLRVHWDQLSLDDWWLPEEAISLYGLPEYAALSAEQKLSLSHHEFINFIEGALWLESLFMERIARSMKYLGRDLARATYRLHELREEAGHSLMFLELMRRSRLPMPRTRFSRANLANVLGRHAPIHSTAFWVAVMIGEEVPDRMNRLIRKHRDNINPVIYDMITIHIIDEARHMAHARESLEDYIQDMPKWQRKLFQPVINRVFKQFVDAFYFPPAKVYELAGLDNGAKYRKLAHKNPHHVDFVDQCVASALGILRQYDLNLNWR